MPALALGALLEPTGLGAPFLWLAGQGIGVMLAIGEWTAGLRLAEHRDAPAMVAAAGGTPVPPRYAPSAPK